MNEGKTILEDLISESCSKIEQDPTNRSSNSNSVLTVRPLYGATEPSVELKHEKPVHRIMINLKAEGYDDEEIGRITGYTGAGVRVILKQEWAMREVLEKIERSGKSQIEKVHSLLHEEMVNNIEFLRDLRDNEKAGIGERRKAANDLLNRTFGHPTQPILHEHKQIDPNQLDDSDLAKIVSGQTLEATN